jgi:hypothetical protein
MLRRSKKNVRTKIIIMVGEKKTGDSHSWMEMAWNQEREREREREREGTNDYL